MRRVRTTSKWPRKAEFERSIVCPACGKVGYIDKRQAKARIRQMEHREGRLNAYRCVEQPDLWHVGHQPHDLTTGEVARAELKARRRTP